MVWFWFIVSKIGIRTYSFYRLSLARQHKETIQYLISTVQDLMLLKQPYIGPKSIIFEVISVISVVISVIPVISVNRRTEVKVGTKVSNNYCQNHENDR